MARKSILHLNHSLFFVWSSLEHETCQLLEFVTINYFPFSMHFLCHTVMNFCERVGEITFVPYFFQENVLSERENFAAATIIFHFYMYLNDQRVEIYLLNWPNYLNFIFCYYFVTFLIIILSFQAVPILAVQAHNSENGYDSFFVVMATFGQ